MTDKSGNYFTLGITGHRNLEGYDELVLRRQVQTTLLGFQRTGVTCRMLNSIAEGADQLCAEIALKLGYALICPLPFPEYEEDFSGEALKNYKDLLKQSEKHFFISNCTDRNDAYLAAGKYIAECCDVLLAIWDGKQQNSGCGTQAVVDYAASIGKKVVIL